MEEKAKSCNHHVYEVMYSGNQICMHCGRDSKRGMVCHICWKGEGIFKKNKLIQKPGKLYHLSCYEEKSLKEKQMEDENREYRGTVENPDFTKRKFNLDNKLERIIEVVYEKDQDIDVKLFLSSNEWSTFSRNYKEKVSNNFIRLLIDVSKKTNSSLISGGRYDFNDDFSKGYSLFVVFRYRDTKLISMISDILRKHRFGCLPTNYSIHAHLNNDHPTEEKAKELLSQITDELSKSVKNS